MSKYVSLTIETICNKRKKEITPLEVV